MTAPTVPPEAPAAEPLERNGGRVLAIVMVLVAVVAAVVWLVTDLDPVNFTRAVPAAEPTASALITQCADVLIDAPGGPGFRAAAAAVTLDNPTDDELRAYVVVDFGDLGLGDSRAIRVKARDKVTVRVAPPVAPRVGGFDCTLIEATFAKP